MSTRAPVHAPSPMNKQGVTVYNDKGQSISWRPIIPHPTEPALEYRILPLRLARFDHYQTLHENVAEALAMLPVVVPESGTYFLVCWGKIILTANIDRWTPDWDAGWDTEYGDNVNAG